MYWTTVLTRFLAVAHISKFRRPLHRSPFEQFCVQGSCTHGGCQFQAFQSKGHTFKLRRPQVDRQHYMQMILKNKINQTFLSVSTKWDVTIEDKKKH